MEENTRPVEEDIKTLEELRDQMSDYLSTMERNTDAINDWLAENKRKIILSYQRLSRAIAQKNEGAATAILSELENEDFAGFVISLTDFKAKADAAFGEDSTFIKNLSKIEPGFSTHIQEDLPEEPNAGDISKLGEKKVVKKERERDVLWHWFNKAEKDSNDSKKEVHELKAEILGLHSDKHYFIDGLMDWAVETLAPEDTEDGGTTADNIADMLKYRNPAYILNFAKKDFADALAGKTHQMAELTHQYSQIANTIDSQNLDDILSMMPNLFQEKDTRETEFLKSLLLEDFKAVSFTELVLENIKNKSDRETLIKAALSQPDRNRTTFSDLSSSVGGSYYALNVFEKFFQMTLKKKGTLSTDVLTTLMDTLTKDYGLHSTSFIFTGSTDQNIFKRIVDTYKDNPEKQKELLSAITTKIKGYDRGISNTFVDFLQSLEAKNSNTLLETLRTIKTEENAEEVFSLFHLCRAKTSLLEALCQVSGETPIKAQIIEEALNAGFLSEMRPDQTGRDRYSARETFNTFVEKEILPHLNEFPIDTARKLIAHSFSMGDLNDLEHKMTSSQGRWLEKIVTSKDIDGTQKAQWVAAFLEPLTSSDIIRANILNDAALSSTKGNDDLSALRDNLSYKNIRLAENVLLRNLDLIANIWYDTDKAALNYTIDGRAETLLEDISLEKATEILDLVERQSDLITEQDGLFNPKHIDLIQHGTEDLKLHFYRSYGPLNTDPVKFENFSERNDFIHIKNKDGSFNSHNINSIALIHQTSDGEIILVDRYGRPQEIEGEIIINDNDQSPLLNLGENTIFNPNAVAIIDVNDEEGTFGIRIESPEFEDLITNYDEEFFYTVQDPSGLDLDKLNEHLQTSDHTHRLNDAGSLYFNMEVLKYLVWENDEEGNSGFYCDRHDPTNKEGFINVEPEMAKELLVTMGNQDDVLFINDTLIHKKSIKNAYYQEEEERIEFIINEEALSEHVDIETANEILSDLIKSEGLMTVAETTLHTGKKIPLDIIRLDSSTSLSYDEEEKRLYITTDSIPFYINLNKKDAMSFLDTLEEDGLEEARALTSDKTWAHDFSATIQNLPSLEISVPPFVEREPEEVLINQFMNRAQKEKRIDLSEIFKTVSELPRSYDTFSYPENKNRRNKNIKPKM